jgi:hypothetical protein
MYNKTAGHQMGNLPQNRVEVKNYFLSFLFVLKGLGIIMAGIVE